MTFRNELTTDAPLQLTCLFGMEGAFSRCIQLPVAGLTIRSGPFVTMPRNRKCIVERIIEALCDKLIVPPGKNVPAWNACECLFHWRKIVSANGATSHTRSCNRLSAGWILLWPIDDLKYRFTRVDRSDVKYYIIALLDAKRASDDRNQLHLAAECF